MWILRNVSMEPENSKGNVNGEIMFACDSLSEMRAYLTAENIELGKSVEFDDCNFSGGRMVQYGHDVSQLDVAKFLIGKHLEVDEDLVICDFAELVEALDAKSVAEIPECELAEIVIEK